MSASPPKPPSPSKSSLYLSRAEPLSSPSRSAGRTRATTPDLSVPLRLNASTAAASWGPTINSNETIQVATKRPEGGTNIITIPLQTPLKPMQSYSTVASVYLDLKDTIMANAYLVRCILPHTSSKTHENARLEAESREMRNAITRGSDKIATALQTFKSTEGELARTQEELRLLREKLPNYQRALQASRSLIKSTLSVFVRTLTTLFGHGESSARQYGGEEAAPAGTDSRRDVEYAEALSG